MSFSNSKFTMSTLEDKLDLDDKSSITFLLCDDPHEAKRILTEALSDKGRNILKDLCVWTENNNIDNVEKKFLECLCLIQQYRALDKLGYTHQRKHFLKLVTNLSQEHSLDAFRKALFLACEKMSIGQLVSLIHLVSLETSIKVDRRAPHNVELNLLCWMCGDYLSTHTISRFLKHIRNVGAHESADFLEDIYKCKNNISDNLNKINDPNDYYCIDASNVGTCIIVNQRKIEGFPHRYGTNKDRDMLEITFLTLGFNVVILENLNNNQFEKKIKDVIRNVNEQDSCLAMCILSHGIRGGVYTSDGSIINILDIKNWILTKGCPQLATKPKILIIQACRKATDEGIPTENVDSLFDPNNSIHTDNNESTVSNSPPAADLLVISSTAEGYLSYRNECLGSIFVQTFCNEILNDPLMSLRDTFLLVNSRIKKQKNKLCKEQIPEESHTFSKILKFPFCKKGQFTAAQKLLVHYLFECLYDHLLNAVYKYSTLRKSSHGKMK